MLVAWRRTWHVPVTRTLLGWAALPAARNSVFDLAVDQLTLGTVAAIEFLPVVVLAACAARTRRTLAALIVAAGGVYLLTDVRLVASPWPTRFCSPSPSS
ncbi:hypothetical protein Aab01nite_04200 [Paractinoplanes abujensis]|uniref:Threonine/homoserine efflux transporter RhtA n=1 Tax=Paractinoplanes abujensis TaxID=882441 RepID=A0A7W7FZ65_9ACTN|nr:threonine/homoserine efflux transporter RhtA [Actinoplanes abujensis]GID16830.1 hypothetical protein Aab01nite_04200 [Actinoplanes abujensis]